MDRSTKATLNTYDTWIQLSRLQKIYQIQDSKIRWCAELLTANAQRMREAETYSSTKTMDPMVNVAYPAWILA